MPERAFTEFSPKAWRDKSLQCRPHEGNEEHRLDTVQSKPYLTTVHSECHISDETD